MLPTVADLLLIDVIRRAARRWSRAPTAWRQGRWVHVLELADAAHLLQAGAGAHHRGRAAAEPALLARYAADLRPPAGPA